MPRQRRDGDAARPRPAPRQPLREAPPEPAAYANQFAVGYNAYEFLFDFGQDYGDADGGRAAVHTRIVAAPAYAKLFRSLLERSIGDYEAAFGPIAQPPQDAPDDDDGEAASED